MSIIGGMDKDRVVKHSENLFQTKRSLDFCQLEDNGCCISGLSQCWRGRVKVSLELRENSVKLFHSSRISCFS